MDGEGRRVLAQFKSEEGSVVGTPFDLPVDTSYDSLLILCNTLLENVNLYTNSLSSLLLGRAKSLRILRP